MPKVLVSEGNSFKAKPLYYRQSSLLDALNAGMPHHGTKPC